MQTEGGKFFPARLSRAESVVRHRGHSSTKRPPLSVHVQAARSSDPSPSPAMLFFGHPLGTELLVILSAGRSMSPCPKPKMDTAKPERETSTTGFRGSPWFGLSSDAALVRDFRLLLRPCRDQPSISLSHGLACLMTRLEGMPFAVRVMRHRKKGTCSKIHTMG